MCRRRWPGSPISTTCRRAAPRLFALPLRKINLGVPQAQALDFDQGGFDLGKDLGILPGRLQHELVAPPQHDGPAAAVEAFDDSAGDGIGGHQCLAGQHHEDGLSPHAIRPNPNSTIAKHAGLCKASIAMPSSLFKCSYICTT